MVGWNERAPIIVSELDRYAAPGSTLTVVTSYGAGGLPATTNLAVTVVEESTTRRAVLDECAAGWVRLLSHLGMRG